MEDGVYHRRWFADSTVYSYQSLQVRTDLEVEKWYMFMCQLADDRMKSETSSAGIQPVVYSRLIDCLNADRVDEQQITKRAGSKLMDHTVAGPKMAAMIVALPLEDLSQRPWLEHKLRKE